MRKWLKRIGVFLLFFFILLNFIAAFHAYKFAHFYDKKDISEIGFGKRDIPGKLSFIFFGPKYPKSEITKRPGFKYIDTTITSSDGFKLAAWQLRHGVTDSVIPKGTVILFHGATSCRSDLVEEIDAVYKMGWDVFTIDFRGNGESDGFTTTFSFHEIDDVKAAYDFIKASGEKKIVLYGESMGAATVLRATALYKLDLYGIISDGAFGSLKEGVEGRIRTMGLPAEPIGNLICFWGSVEEWYWIFGIKPTEYAKKITCPILIEWGSIDERVKRSEAELIYKNLASVNKKFIEYKGCGHESFYAKLPQEWVKNVSAFLNR